MSIQTRINAIQEKAKTLGVIVELNPDTFIDEQHLNCFFWRKGRSKPMDEIKRALLGDHEAAKRLTEAGVLLPCPGCKGDNIVDWYRHNEVWYQCDDCGWEGPSVYSKGFADTEQARLAWNTRAPILSSREMEILEGLE